MTAEPPLIVGLPTRVRLMEPLGVGVAATVWRGRDTLAGVDVAVKVLPPADARAADLHRERFERESRALARLHGVDGVVGLHEMGVAPDGTAWLVMDLAAPASLRERWERGDEIDVARLGVALATALARAHDVGVVHGDISPSNVLFDHGGGPLLADFGMAALRGGGAGTEGVAGCTPAYAAPERLRGGPPDMASDVYALAATLWHAAHGAPPSDRDRTRSGALAAPPADRPTAAEFARSLGAPDPESGGARGRRLFRRRR